MYSILKKNMILIFMVLIVISVVALFETEYAHAVKKYKLPVKIAEYEKFKGKWEKSVVTKYKYDKKNNRTKVIFDNDFVDEKCKYIYKNGKLVKVKNDRGVVKVFGSDGHIIKAVWGTTVTKYKTNEKGYIIQASIAETYKNTISYYKNGMPYKMISKSPSGTDTTVFTRKGTIKRTKNVGENLDGSYITTICKYKYKKKGKNIIITEIDHGKPYRKYVYYFGKKKTANKRKYVAMMSDCIENLGSFFPELFI